MLLANLFFEKFPRLIPRKNRLGNEAEFNAEIDLKRAIVDRTKYDFADMTEVRFGETFPVVSNLSEDEVERLLKKCALRDFIFRLNDGRGTPMEFLFHCYGKHAPKVMARDGRAYRLVCDFSMIDEDGKISFVTQTVVAERQKPLAYCHRQVAFRSGIFENGGVALDFVEEGWYNLADFVMHHYLFLMHKFTHSRGRIGQEARGERTRFVVSSGGEEVSDVPDEAAEVFETEAGSKAKVVKLNAEWGPEEFFAEGLGEFDDAASERHNVINCPYWTVRGHFRHYKSGKVVWIEPYAKGRHRDDPSRIAPKRYV